MKDIIDEIDSRIKSPLFGYFLFSLIAFNWEEMFYLVVDIGSVSKRIEYFHNGTNLYSLLIYPFLVASVYAIAYPWLSYLFMRLSTKPAELKNSLHAESEHKFLTKKQDLEKTRSELLRSAEVELIERAKRDAELGEIEDEGIREKLQTEIEQLRQDRDELSISLNESQRTKASSLPKEQEQIIRLITTEGGTMLESSIIEISNFDKVKTEYLLEDLEQSDYLKKDYNDDVGVYYYYLTTKSKKLMVEKGFAK
ncbi:hypothetical protein [Teredinibacter purpureus]|uniref:hypothetical protein n=1 Tax=Teredinibacter purpureus TaxID=2731756 RepID=UPI0005F811A9|nr:hypothetical protein [Teredinibacter purpureus]